MALAARRGPYLHTHLKSPKAKSPRFIGGFSLDFVSPKFRTKCLSLFQWWRWGESNPRPKRLWPNIYACSPPLISHPVRRRTGLSGRNRSVIRGPSARTERPRASPARLCRCGLAGVRRATSGPLIRPRERNRCSQLQFFPFFNEANENPRRAIWSPRIPSKPDHPQASLRKTARIIVFLPPGVKGSNAFF